MQLPESTHSLRPSPGMQHLRHPPRRGRKRSTLPDAAVLMPRAAPEVHQLVENGANLLLYCYTPIRIYSDATMRLYCYVTILLYFHTIMRPCFHAQVQSGASMLLRAILLYYYAAMLPCSGAERRGGGDQRGDGRCGKSGAATGEPGPPSLTIQPAIGQAPGLLWLEKPSRSLLDLRSYPQSLLKS